MAVTITVNLPDEDVAAIQQGDVSRVGQATQVFLDAVKAAPKVQQLPESAERIGFLDLPPEVRNQIYEYALGGQRIHARLRNSKDPEDSILRMEICLVSSQCKASCDALHADRDEHAEAAGEAEQEQGAEHTLKSVHYCTTYDDTCYIEQHSACHQRHSSIGQHLTLNLLRACKQVHHEAALIPFATNSFDMDLEYNTLGAFTSYFDLHQLSAIQSLVLSADIRKPQFGSPSSNQSITRQSVERLSAIHHLEIHVQTQINGYHNDDTYLEQKTSDYFGLFGKHGTLASAEVVVHFSGLVNPKRAEKLGLLVEHLKSMVMGSRT